MSHFANSKFILLVLCTIFISGCAIGPQLRSYTDYRVLDLKATNDEILVVLRKSTWRYRLSLSAAIMGENHEESSKESYRLIVFSKDYAWQSRDGLLTVSEVRKIATGIESFPVDMRICNKNQVISPDILNRKLHRSILNITDIVTVKNISDDFKEPGVVSYDGCFVFFTGKNFIYSCERGVTEELPFSLEYKSPIIKKMALLINSADNQNIFIYSLGEDHETQLVKINIVDLKNDSVISEFLLPYYKIHDFEYRGEDSIFVTIGFHDAGITLYDFHGHPLYNFKDPFTEHAVRAVINDNKVYAVGQRIHQEAYRYSPHLELLIWDYKNNKTITKTIPMDSNEFDW